VPDTKLSEHQGDGAGTISRAIVTHETFHLDAERGVVGESLLEEDLYTLVFFIRQDGPGLRRE
jgi:hypothetical protein